MNTSKLPHVPAPQQPKATPVVASKPIQDLPHPWPVAAATPTHEDIARRAYEIYVEKGYPQGQSEQNWQQAEQEQRNRGLATHLSK